jgi:hypothetical protein
MRKYVKPYAKFLAPYTEKKDVVRNLKRVPRIVTNSKPFLVFVPIRFRTRLFFTIEKKGFVQDCFFTVEKKGFVQDCFFTVEKKGFVQDCFFTVEKKGFVKMVS